MKFTSIFFKTNESILEIHLKDTNKRAKTYHSRVIIIDHKSHGLHSKFAVDCDVSRINQEIWNKN